MNQHLAVTWSMCVAMTPREFLYLSNDVLL